jgi:N-acetylglucosamine-6-phosphate deacetylase
MPTTVAHRSGHADNAKTSPRSANGIVLAVVAASSSAAAAIGPGWSKGRLRRGYDADVLIVDGDLAADLTALRHVRQVVLRGMPVSPSSAQT